MQFSGRIRKKLRLAGDQRNACYPHSLQFYLQPPSENISLTEFESLAVDRLKCKWHLISNICILGVRSCHWWPRMEAVRLYSAAGWLDSVCCGGFVSSVHVHCGRHTDYWVGRQGLCDEDCNAVLC